MRSKNSIFSFSWLRLAILLEGLFCLFWIISIPPDPKNNFFMGYSLIRWVQLIGIFIGTILLTISSEKIISFIQKKRIKAYIKFFSIISILLFMFLLFTPSYRLIPYGAEFERLRPLVAWGLLFLSNFYFYIKIQAGEIRFQQLFKFSKLSKNTFIFFTLLVFFGILWILLRILYPTQLSGDLIFAPPAPVSSLQFFILLIFIWFLNQSNYLSNIKNKSYYLLVIFIFLATLLLWVFLPMPCTDDRIGPFPPNFICYPPSNDAIYSIASHYGRLGSGIYNHWFTDKPLYIFFLMITQWLSSPNIDQYIILQIIFLALIPVLLIYFTKKIHGLLSGILLSLLIITREANNIYGYQMFGGTNPQIESTEDFVSLFLIIFGIILFIWFKNKNNNVLPALAGSILGLSSLIRLNPVFIFPITLIFIFIIFKRNFKRSILISIIFSIGFLCSFAPWYIFSKDRNGQNHLLIKINEVIQTRYQSNIEIENKAAYPEENLQNYKVALPLNPTYFKNQEISNFTRISLHFINNNFQIITTLPMDFNFHKLKNLSGMFAWKDHSGYSIWYYPLSFNNILFLIFNFSMILLGIKNLFIKYGLAGISPLIIQVGYTLGNGIAITSGSRYIIPVIWVSFLFFSIGIVELIKWVQKSFLISNNIVDEESENKSKPTLSISSTKNDNLFISIILLCSFFFSFGLTQLEKISNKLEIETFISENNYYSVMSKYMDSSQLNQLSKSNGIEIYYGISYQPKFYRNYFYNTAPDSFELVTLSKKNVIVSYIKAFPNQYFSEESETLIIGCLTKEEIRWGADFIIVDAFAIIQVDHENSIFITNDKKWECNITK